MEPSVESLKHRVDDAKLRLDFTTIYLSEVHHDLRAGNIPTSYPDAREGAIRCKRNALREYRQAVRSYQDFIAPKATETAA